MRSKISSFAIVTAAIVAILSLGSCSSSGSDDATTLACEAAMKLRTQGGSMEERQLTLDEALLQARMSMEPRFVAVVEDADTNAGGIININDVVSVCRELGYNIPDRE